MMMNNTTNQLLAQVYETGFALDEINLYLDTHPSDPNALSYYRYAAGLWQQAVSAYENQCGPLTIDRVNASNYWNWINDKWPWEGGNC